MAERLFLNYNKKNSKYKMAEYSIMTRFSSRFETVKTLQNKDLYDANVLKGVLFVLTNRDTEVTDISHTYLVNDAYRLRIFAPSKIKSLIQEGKLSEGCRKLEELLNKKWPNLLSDSLRLYHKVVLCLVEYFDYGEYAKKNSESVIAVLMKLLSFCFTLTAESYCLKEYSTLNDKEKEEFDAVNTRPDTKKDNSWNLVVKNNPLKSDYFLIGKDKSIKDDFALIYESIFKYWYCELYDVDISLRNSPQSLGGVELKNNWDILFKLLDKSYYKNTTVVSGSLDSAFAPRLKTPVLLKYDEYKSFFEFVFSTISDSVQTFYVVFVRDIFNSIVSDFYTEILKKNNDEKVNLTTELRELKSVNRNLTKSVTKLNSDNDELKTKIEQGRLELERARELESESQELIELRKQVESLRNENNTLIADLRKLENKNTWYSEKITDLESELRTYDGIEQSLMVLQNENNVLLADIEKIESLENSEDEDAEFERKLNVIREEPILFIGGSGDMVAKFIELFPNSENINISDNNPNFTIPTRIKYVAIYTKVVKHCFCERAESFVDKENIIYLNILNKKLVVDELYKRIVGHKK